MEDEPSELSWRPIGHVITSHLAFGGCYYNYSRNVLHEGVGNEQYIGFDVTTMDVII